MTTGQWLSSVRAGVPFVSLALAAHTPVVAVATPGRTGARINSGHICVGSLKQSQHPQNFPLASRWPQMHTIVSSSFKKDRVFP